MSKPVVFFLLTISQVLALFLALLGVMTFRANPCGALLTLIGIGYAAGTALFLVIRKKRFWEPGGTGAVTYEERGDRSLWRIALGMIAVFFLSPLEYLYFAAVLPRNALTAFSGASLAAAGILLFVWARRALQKNYSGHLSVKTDQTLVQNGPYRAIRHPAYAGYLLMALGIGLGYASLAGLISFVILLIPGMIYRMNAEEKLLIEHFGENYVNYARKTKRIIPGIW